MMIVRGVNVFPSQIEEQILKHPELSPHYQIELSQEGHMKTMTVDVEVKQDSLDEAARQQSAQNLAHSIKSMVGVSARIQIKPVGGVERSQGKARRVIEVNRE